jgi:hypothetical protein
MPYAPKVEATVHNNNIMCHVKCMEVTTENMKAIKLLGKKVKVKLSL